MNKKLFAKNYLRKLCQQYNLDSPKDWGQHFLLDEQIVKTIVEAGKVEGNDNIIEIGPGFGTLTFTLSEQADQVTAFEIEKKLKSYWKENKKKNINIIWGDALDKFQQYGTELSVNYKFISNLPYQITSRVFRAVLEMKNKPSNMTVMIQKEVAQRICTTDDKSKLTVAVNLFGNPELIKTVPRESFYPKPQVDSAILTIKNIEEPEVNEEDFFKVVSAGFSHRRKQLKNNLSSSLGVDKQRVKEMLEVITGNGKIRAQKLSIKQWKQLSQKLKDSNLVKK